MKINSAISTVANAPDTKRARGPSSETPRTETGTGERIDISSLSTQLQGAAAGEAPINAERVAEIKQAIAEGRFQINPERIADGVLTSVREMLGRAAGTD